MQLYAGAMFRMSCLDDVDIHAAVVKKDPEKRGTVRPPLSRTRILLTGRRILPSMAMRVGIATTGRARVDEQRLRGGDIACGRKEKS